MTLQTTKFGLACASAAAILWIFCSLLFMLMPMKMMNMSGHMMHGNFTEMQWQLSLHGVFFGLISWAIISGVAGWLVASIYNRLLRDSREQS